MNEIVIAIVGVSGTLLGVLVTLCASRAQLWPKLEAVFMLRGDGTTPTVSITNTGDKNFTVIGILLDLYGDKRRIKNLQVGNLRFKGFPQYLECGASIVLDIVLDAGDADAIYVKSRIVLQLSDGTRIFCKRGVLRDVD